MNYIGPSLEDSEVQSMRKKILGANLAGVQLMRKYNKGVRFLMCVIDSYKKYAWVVSLKGKKVLKLLMHFKKF